MHKISICALWLQRSVGKQGYIGAILADGTPVALCSKESWDLGRYDSLRKGWTGDVRIGTKILLAKYSEADLRADGIDLKGFTPLIVPGELLHLVKKDKPAAGPVKLSPTKLTNQDWAQYLWAVAHVMSKLDISLEHVTLRHILDALAEKGVDAKVIAEFQKLEPEAFIEYDGDEDDDFFDPKGDGYYIDKRGWVVPLLEGTWPSGVVIEAYMSGSTKHVRIKVGKNVWVAAVHRTVTDARTYADANNITINGVQGQGAE